MFVCVDLLGRHVKSNSSQVDHADIINARQNKENPCKISQKISLAEPKSELCIRTWPFSLLGDQSSQPQYHSSFIVLHNLCTVVPYEHALKPLRDGRTEPLLQRTLQAWLYTVPLRSR